MIFDTHAWLNVAGRVARTERKEWLTAMAVEAAQIENTKERHEFAYGCFKTALNDRIRSRQSLHYIARISGAILIMAMSFMGLLTIQGNTTLGTEAIKLISFLCMSYLGASCLLLVSLTGLRIYAAIGTAFAGCLWLYCVLLQPEFTTIPLKFLTAIAVEIAGFSISLILITIYLNWLYDADLAHD